MLVDIDVNRMDLTGVNEAYKRIGIPFSIFKANQFIDLTEPAFASSIVVKDIDDNDITFTVGTVDDTATSKAKYAITQVAPGSEFTGTLVNSITITGYTGTEFIAYVTYQALYKDTTTIIGDSVGPAYSPGLMRSVLNRLSYLTDMLPPIPNLTDGTVNTIQVLPEDLTGMSEDNYIQDEIHMQVNTLANRFIVRPANGSFYKHDLVVKFNDTPLVENIDYEVTSVNIGKTRVSSHTSGVYDYIKFITPLSAGIVTINYHAFGGAICPLTIGQVKETLASIIEYIKLGNFITTASLQNHPVILSILDRISIIENMLHISVPITYTYNSGILDSWVTVARIYPNEVSGLTDTTGVGHFRMRCGKYFSEFKLNYDVRADRVLDLHVISSWGTTLKQDDEAYFTNRICPKFRIIWTDDIVGGEHAVTSGILLQMSVTNYTDKTLSVEMQNIAGVFSHWQLIPTDGNPLPPTLISETLPDGSTWDSDEATCRASNSVIPCGKYYTIFSGTVPTKILDNYTYKDVELIDPQDNSSLIQEKLRGLSVSPCITGYDVDMEEVEAIAITMYDRYTGSMITKTSNNLGTTETSIKTSVMYFTQDLCIAECELVKAGLGYELYIGSSTGTNSKNNDRFDFKQIDVLFKGVVTYD